MTRISFSERIARAKSKAEAQEIVQEALTDCSEHLMRLLRTYDTPDHVFIIAAMELYCAAVRSTMPQTGIDTIEMLKAHSAVVQY